MHVVATAGHVDHGKSTLVRALTGTDPDRLAEERRRGLTIELGYAWTELEGPGEVAFVDVPGHERFLSTMLAGVGPVPVALLVVAADDPWMPQAAEHLAALDALGVEHGLIAVTRADLADPAPAMARALEEVARTSLAGARAVAVSAPTGAGLDVLRAELARLLAAAPAPDPGGPVRLWVDRRFGVRGAGTVVTGTLPSGTIAVDDVLATPGGERVRVRGLEALGRERSRISGPARVALNLGGRVPEAIGRGTPLLDEGAYHTTSIVDVELSADDRVPQRPQLHIGSAQISVHARPLGGRFHRLVLTDPLPLRFGDRAVLRDPGDRRVWGVRVVDPAPPDLNRRGAAAARAQALAGLDGTVGTHLALRGIARAELLERCGVRGDVPPDAVRAGAWLVSPAEAARWRRALQEHVAAADRGGVTPAAAAHALGLPEAVIAEALVAPPLEYAEGRIRRIGSADASLLSPAQKAALARLRSLLTAEPFAAPTADQLAEAGIDDATLAALHRARQVLRLAPGIVLLPDAADRALDRLAALPQPFTTSQARQAWGTSRRVALPLLAHLDASRRTVRLADDTRRLTRPAG
jgi:selenocysteine-specific elongation factor